MLKFNYGRKPAIMVRLWAALMDVGPPPASTHARSNCQPILCCSLSLSLSLSLSVFPSLFSFIVRFAKGKKKGGKNIARWNSSGVVVHSWYVSSEHDTFELGGGWCRLTLYEVRGLFQSVRSWFELARINAQIVIANSRKKLMVREKIRDV